MHRKHKKKQIPPLTNRQKKDAKKESKQRCKDSETPQKTTDPVSPKQKKATKKQDKSKTHQVKCSKCPTHFKRSSKKETLCASCDFYEQYRVALCEDVSI